MLEYLLKVESHHSVLGGMLCGIALVIIGSRIKRRTPLPPALTPGEKEFLKIFDVLKNLDTYFENETEFEFSRFEAAKTLSKVEKDLYKPKPSSSGIYGMP